MVRELIISMAEEDYCGTWEVVWRLRSALPWASNSELTNIAKEVVEELIEGGQISLFMKRDFASKEEEVPIEQTAILLSNINNWNEPTNKDSQQLLIATKSP